MISANEFTVSTHGFTNSKEISTGKGTINAVGTVRNDDRINSNELTVNAGEIVNSRKIETGKGTFTSAGDIVNNDIMIGNTLNFKGRNLVNGEGFWTFGHAQRDVVRSAADTVDAAGHYEIGRASCRERV